MSWLRRRPGKPEPRPIGDEVRRPAVDPGASQVVETAASRQLRLFLAELQAAGGVSAAAALVGTPSGVIGSAALIGDGESTGEGATSLFDLASLTKPFMATLALRLHLSHRLPLDLPVGEIWPGSAPGLARRTLSELLRHRAGFQPWTPLYNRCHSLVRVPSLLVSGVLLGAEPGTYSDLSYMLWGLAAEKWLSTSLADLVALELGPFGAPRELLSSPGALPGVVSCRLGNAKEVELAAAQGFEVETRPGPRRGEVQDGNAAFLGGVAGHAGLFGSTHALWRLAREWLHPRVVLEKGAVAGALGGPGPYALGWARKRDSDGPTLSASSFGHTGFTGGALWIDPETRRIFVLLAHRRAVSVDLGPWRKRFIRLAAGLE